MSDLSCTESPGRRSWLQVAALMGWKPEVAVLRKFRKLNILRLLEMQSHILSLEKDYAKFCSLDAGLDCPSTRSYKKNWQVLDASQGQGGTFQRDAWRTLRDELDAYSEDAVWWFNLEKIH